MERNNGILAVVYLQLRRTAKGEKKSKLNIQQFFQNRKKKEKRKIEKYENKEKQTKKTKLKEIQNKRKIENT